MKNRLLFAFFCFALLMQSHAANRVVQLSGNTFSPSTLTIAKGDSVTWTNLDFVNHNSISGAPCGTPSGVWTSPTLGNKGTYTFTFNVNATTYPYYCSFHCPGMTASITVTNPPNISPTVTLTNPANNAVIAANAAFIIGASASDSDGTITNVAFLVGTNLISNDTTSPFDAVTNLAAGTYTLSAVASDNGGAKTTNSVSITVNAPPTLSLSPVGPFTVSENSPLSFNVNGSDTDALTISSPNLPAGATLTGSGNSRTFTWSPDYGHSYASPYSVSFIANDGINPPVTNSPGITVNPVFTPIAITNFVRSSNQVQFHVSGLRLTRTNFIQVSSNLPSWVSIRTNISTNTALDFVDTNATTNGLYRIQETR